MTDTAFHHVAAGTRPLDDRLPERLHGAGISLFVADSVAALVALVLAVALDVAAPAFLTLAATLLIALACGRYRRSYAVNANEEWYQAAGVAFLGLCCGMLLAVMLRFSPFGPLVAAVLWTLGAGFASGYLARTRRAGRTYGVTLERVHERPLSLGGHVEHGIIRLLDTLFAGAALIVLSPLLLLVALAILIDDGGPVVFSQTRIGRDDRDFTMYKFRTMRREAGDDWVKPGDDRITRTGRWLRRTSIDELPQLWNVLIGEMSLVGARPEMREYAEDFSHAYQQYSQRHILRPGLTGWAQIRMPRNLEPSDAPDVLRHDLFYVQHAGLYLYLFSLMKTAAEFVTHRAV